MPSYGFGPKASTEAERAGAASFRAEAEKRLQGDNPIPMPEDQGPFNYRKELLEGGKGEKIAGWLGTGLSAYGDLATRKSDLETLQAVLKKYGLDDDSDDEKRS